MNRRRFFAMLCALGLGQRVAGRANGAEGSDSSLRCSTSLERGVIPGVTGARAAVSGRPGAARVDGRLDFISEPIVPAQWLRLLDEKLIRERWSYRSAQSSMLPDSEELVVDPDRLRLSIRLAQTVGPSEGWLREAGNGISMTEVWLVLPAALIDSKRRGPFAFRLLQGQRVLETLPAQSRTITFETGDIAGMREFFWQVAEDPSLHERMERLFALENFEVSLVDRDGSEAMRCAMDMRGYSVARAWIMNSVQQMRRNHRNGACLPGSVDPQCYLTTATAGSLGLSDDCWELRTLRRFRDNCLMATPQGRAEARQYYALAPRIVESVTRRTDSRQIWRRVYWTGVLPAALLIRCGANSMALRVYRRMTCRLRRYCRDSSSAGNRPSSTACGS